MAQLEHRRSQVIARLPVDHVAATLVLLDGERLEVTLFVTPGEGVTRLLEDGEPFVPVGVRDGIRIVARAAIACIALPVAARRHDLELPEERRAVRLRLRSGLVLEGELRWIAPADRRRTADYLNDPGPYAVLHGVDTITYISKAELVWVEERR